MSPAASRTIIGLVDAGGAAGGRAGGTDQWSLMLQLAGWRHPGAEVVLEERSCEMSTSEDDLDSLMEVIGPYSIIEAEIDDESSAAVTKLRRIVNTGARDAELEQLASELQNSIVLNDVALGRLVYDRKFSWYEGRAKWCGEEVEVSLSCASPAEPTAVLELTTQLFKEQEQWNRRVREYAVEQLLPLKNDSWLDEDEAETSAEEFLSKMSLRSISMDESGGFEFWHDDGDLFLGHTIQISGNLSDGLTDADIPG